MKKTNPTIQTASQNSEPFVDPDRTEPLVFRAEKARKLRRKRIIGVIICLVLLIILLLVGYYVLLPNYLEEKADRELAAGDSQSAIENYEKALAVHLDDADLYRKIATVYEKQGDYDQAVDVLEQGVGMVEDSSKLSALYEELLVDMNHNGSSSQEIAEITRQAYDATGDEHYDVSLASALSKD